MAEIKTTELIRSVCGMILSVSEIAEFARKVQQPVLGIQSGASVPQHLAGFPLKEVGSFVVVLSIQWPKSPPKPA